MSEVIIDNLDLWTSALLTKSSAGRGKNGKQEAYGIKKLRELIFELAMRGKLVPQDPNDEPANVLLDTIAKVKIRLLNAGEIKRGKPLPAIGDDELPDQLPKGWSVARLGEVLNVINGRAYKKDEMLQDGTPLLRVGNLFTSSEWYYSNLELEPEKYIDNGDLIYAWSASFGPFIWNGGKVIYHYHIWKLDLYDAQKMDKWYLHHFLSAVTEEIKASGSGIAMIHMTKDRMEKLVVPVPPTEEQHRIVAKVDELMALCDQLEHQQANSIEAHQTLVETLLGTLIRAESQQEVTEAWARIADHFDTLFTTEHSIDQLKKTILQLAVTGKLVPQDPNDGPAKDLLNKIAAEKTRLIKQGKISKEKPAPKIAEEYVSPSLPAGWEAVRFSRLMSLISGQHLNPDEYSSAESHEMIPYLTGPAEFGELSPVPTRYTKERRAVAERGDVLITCKGSGVGKTNVADRQIAISRQLMCIRPIVVTTEFTKLLADSLEEVIRENIIGIAIPGISREDVLDAVVHLPPLGEQDRIIAKVDELMALCDALKARIKDAQATQIHLADAIVEQAVA